MMPMSDEDRMSPAGLVDLTHMILKVVGDGSFSGYMGTRKYSVVHTGIHGLIQAE